MGVMMSRLLVLASLLWPLVGQTKEVIISYDSEIVVHVDGSQTVTETIRVKAEGDRIKRGIYRDFPTTYEANGRRYKVDFQVVDVQRDGKKEPWHTTRLSNGTRVYMGERNTHLEPGEYRYTLTYFTDRQLGFFESHDELYWNVTGNGWDFQIEQASARVLLPPAVPVEAVRAEGYTGRQGSKARHLRTGKSNTAVEYFTTRSLGPREGLTIVASWPKGYIVAPTAEDRLRWLWRDEPGLIIIWLGVLGLLIYYGLVWLRVGRDPQAGVVIPEYEPPAGYSPASIRVIRRMGYDDKTLSAALVSASVKGAITLDENSGKFTATATGQAVDQLTADEALLLDTITSNGLVFKQKNHEAVRGLIKAHKEKLDEDYRKRYFYANRGWAFPGWVASILLVAYAGYAAFQSHGAEVLFYIFMSCFVTGFSAPFLTQCWRMRKPYNRRPSGWFKLVASGIPAIILGFVLLGSEFVEFFSLLPWEMTLGLVVVILINFIFNHLIKAPTRKGRQLLDRVEGFRQYLSIAEGDELRARYAKPVTPEVFEAFLPYAIALDVETEWADRFAEDLREAGQDPGAYHSRWYRGSDYRGVHGLSSSVSSALASSVSSSSHAPGSSSGGGGGGFSGGGGGGGGGGGW